ncbi:MAG: hypothetical protein WCF67_25540, partial [Chitinophagaceae bacterium]
DSATYRRAYQWTSYDSASATSFFVTRKKLSPYLWVQHDSVLLIKSMKDLLEKHETLLGYKLVRNGNSSGLEFSVSKANSSLVQRMRILLNGDAIYLLQTDVPEKYWKQYDFQHFLEGFRFTKEIKPDFLTTNSFDKFLLALRSSDSAVHTSAYEAIEDLIVDSTLLKPLLHAATAEYPSDTVEYTRVSQKLLDLAFELEHSGFNQAVEDHYNALKPLQEQFRYSLLGLLARRKTTESYAIMEKLLKKGLPSKGDATDLTYELGDSLQLLKKLYPWLITLSADTLLGNALFNLHATVIDSSMVNFEEFRSREEILLKAAKNELAAIAADKRDFYYSAGLSGIIEVLGKLKTAVAYEMLRQFMSSKFISVKYLAALQILRNDQKVDAGVLLAIAADTMYRTDIYGELKKLKLEKLFPVKYLNQRAFAQSYVYNSLEDIPSRMELVGEKTVVFKGKKQKFFLYKCTFQYGDDEPEHYLCVGGGFNIDGKTVVIADDDNISGMYVDEEFRQSSIDRHFREYLASFANEDIKDDE